MKRRAIILILISVSSLALLALIIPFHKDYLSILRQNGGYNLADKRTIPVFTYQSADDPNLVMLRKTYNLDSIAGKGDDVSKVLNLLYWLHNLVPHDGNKDNPTEKNSLSLLAICKKENRSLNCRGLGTVLNECYLAMGFKSRLVTCLPKDTTDTDCHVINTVYITSLRKWIWVDPTVAGYVKDENGNLLSIEEARERLVNSEPVNLNADANWNHRQKKNNKNWLFTYMAKNLYRLECATSSEYNLETKTPGKQITYVQLLPLDVKQAEDNKTTNFNKKSEVTYTVYVTNNPKLFWAAPGD